MTFWQTLLCTLITSIVSFLASSGVWSYKTKKLELAYQEKIGQARANSAVQNMLLGLGHDKILYLTDKYIKRGGLTTRELTNLRYLYKPYKELGGNGDCETGMNTCEKMEIITEDEAEARDRAIHAKLFKEIETRREEAV